MTEILRQSLWPGLILFAALCISDFVLTMIGARLYRAQDKIVFEGSFELTPAFQADVDAQRWFSPQSMMSLSMTLVALWFVWQVSAQFPGWELAYPLFLGALLLIQLAIHMRHVRNSFSFRRIMGSDIRGRLEYSRDMVLRASSLELVSFAGLYTILFLATGSWFTLGGAGGCAIVSMSHWRLARKHARANQGREPFP